jgi:hypothetical protein
MNGIGTHTGQTYIQTFIFIYIGYPIYIGGFSMVYLPVGFPEKMLCSFLISLACVICSVTLVFINIFMHAMQEVTSLPKYL